MVDDDDSYGSVREYELCHFLVNIRWVTYRIYFKARVQTEFIQ